MAATKMVFHHMVLIFHSFKDFSDLDLDMQIFQIRKTSGLEDFQTTSRKTSRRLPGRLPDDFQMTSRKSERFGFIDLGLIYMFFRSESDFGRPMGNLLGSLLKYNALEDFQQIFQTTSKKSSRRLPGSLQTGSSSISSGV
ncbi:hypothetical protein F2Q70_00017868 [Brassica cretica]|uniref:Uncharacterized protein n=1 Tax=Brassica cretica TaxID=69181 RepID=A0A8S9L3J1_BRACR|nr:hypothetical protein F2Q70_00017868 [Brassica cretica]KAF2600056.1 hypothetical protein F2Q68_00010841 [Brassica cretica]